MKSIAYFRSVASRFFHRSQAEHELEEELRSHIDLHVADLERLGLSRAEAERRARIEFGSRERFKEECRETLPGNFIDILFQDVRFSIRMLRKSPGFTIVAVLTMALGIGATTAIFSLVDATLLQTLPYRDPEQLVRIQDDLPGVGARDVGMSQPEWQDLQHSGIFEYVSPTWYDDNNLTGSSRPARVSLLIVAPNYFAVLGVKPELAAPFRLRTTRLDLPRKSSLAMDCGSEHSEETETSLAKAFGWTPTCTELLGSCRQVFTTLAPPRERGISKFGRPPVFTGYLSPITRREADATFRQRSRDLNRG